MKKHRKRYWVAAALGALLLFVTIRRAEARLGGGGGGGGGDADDVVGCLIELVIEIIIEFGPDLFELFCNYPIPCSIVIGVFVLVVFIASIVAPAVQPDKQTASETAWLDGLVAKDRNFSVPVFLDFAVLLFMRAKDAASKKNTETMRPYVAADVLPLLGVMSTGENVCVESAEILAPSITEKKHQLPVRFKASVTSPRADGTLETTCIEETWTFERNAGVSSRSPEHLENFGCPACGNKEELKPDGRCTSCGHVVTDGRFDWSVSEIRSEKRWRQEAGELASLLGRVEPATRVDSRFESERRAFVARYPGFSVDEFEQMVRRTFLALQDAWTTRRFSKARPYESDAIYQTHRFWIESYLRHGRTNVLEEIAVDRVRPVKIARDAFYDSITVRIWMSMIDYTKEDATGRVLSGDPKTRSSVSEYWTFIRRSGFDPRVNPDPGVKCPSCGAEVKVSDAGVCAYCSAKVTSGKFGWVLSRIDQDSTYDG